MALMQAFYFLLSTLLALLTYPLMIQCVFLYFSGRVYDKTQNQLSLGIEAFFYSILKPMRAVLLSVHQVDFALLAIVYSGHMCYLALKLLFVGGSFSMIFVGAIFATIQQILNVIFYSVLGMIFLSWIAPRLCNPLTDIMFCISEGLLRPIRKYTPQITGIDLSALFGLIFLQFIDIAFVRAFLF